MKKKLYTLLMFLVCSSLEASASLQLSTPTDLSSFVLVHGGDKKHIADWKGTALIVLYGMDWCTYCHKALPDFDTVSASYAESKVKFMVVTTAHNNSYTSFTQKFLNLTTYGDNDGILRAASGIRAFPTFLFIDANGQLVGYKEGDPQWSSPETKAFVDNFLKGKVPASRKKSGFMNLIVDKIKSILPR